MQGWGWGTPRVSAHRVLETHWGGRRGRESRCHPSGRSHLRRGLEEQQREALAWEEPGEAREMEDKEQSAKGSGMHDWMEVVKYTGSHGCSICLVQRLDMLLHATL